jgi:hypothetical protein
VKFSDFSAVNFINRQLIDGPFIIGYDKISRGIPNQKRFGVIEHGGNRLIRLHNSTVSVTHNNTVVAFFKQPLKIHFLLTYFMLHFLRMLQLIS